MSKLRALLIAAVWLALPGMALAQGAPQWSYIEAGFIDFDPDEGLSDDGWFAGGSVQIFDNFHLLAEYDDIGDYTFWNAGGGWHGLLGDNADLFAQVLWANVEVDEGDVDEDGYEVQAGVRWKALEWLEISGQANWADYGGNIDNEATFGVGALFTFLDDRMGFGAKYELGDSDTLRLFFRLNFGQ